MAWALYNFGMGYKTRANNNIVYICTYHVVWCVKYRRPLLTEEIGDRLKEIVAGVIANTNSELHEIETMPDHVHVLVGCDPSFGIPRLVRLMKGRSSHHLRQEYAPLRTRVPSLWTTATFIATTGGAPLVAIKRYIENQRPV